MMEGYVGCGTSEKLHSGDGQPCIRISDITEMGQLKKVALSCHDDAPLLEEGDILFARVGNHMFKSYLYDPADGRVSFASFLIRFHIEKDNPKYIQYYALSPRFQSLLQASCAGSTRNVVGARELQAISLPHTERSAQDAVVEKLAPIYESYAVAYKKERILDQYARDRFACLFPPFAQIGTVLLSELTVRKAGKGKKDTGGPVPIYNSGGITGGTFESMPEKEAILIPKKGSLNNVIYASRPFWASGTMARLLPKEKYDMYFLYCLLRSCNLMLLNSDSNAPGIHPKILDSLELPDYPKELKQQFYTEMEPFFHEIGILRNKKVSLTLQPPSPHSWGN